MRYSTIKIASVIAPAYLAWLLLGLWIPGESERFYLLVPPVALGLFLASGHRPWQQLREQWLRAVVLVLCLGLVCAAYAWSWSLAVSVPLLTMVPEIVLGTYFLVGVLILTGAVRVLFRRSGRWLGNRCFGPCPTGRLSFLGRALIADALPTLLLGIVVLGYLLAVMNVHRYRIPNVATPQSALGRLYEDVEFVTDDGLTIRGWFIPAKAPSVRTVLICHGLGANRSMFLGYVKAANALEANVLMFDFRGHGDSDGHTTTLGHREKLDVLAAISYLRGQRAGQAREVIGLGISMGSAALLRAAADLDQPLHALIIDSGFASAVELTDSILAAFPAPTRPPLTLVGVPLASLHAGCWLPDVRPVDCIGAVRAPVLVVHSRQDPLIPVHHGERLFQSAATPKTLLLTDTQGHGSPLSGAEAAYLQAATDLLKCADQRTAVKGRTTADLAHDSSPLPCDR
jgi:pimeloyl-ACP methyl ester carboxylesterase